MRAIIIDEKDCLALLDQLKLESLRKDHPNLEEPGKPLTISGMHRIFHYKVVQWLQDQGADCVRR
jgi:hypothetical protein